MALVSVAMKKRTSPTIRPLRSVNFAWVYPLDACVNSVRGRFNARKIASLTAIGLVIFLWQEFAPSQIKNGIQELL